MTATNPAVKRYATFADFAAATKFIAADPARFTKIGEAQANRILKSAIGASFGAGALKALEKECGIQIYSKTWKKAGAKRADPADAARQIAAIANELVKLCTSLGHPVSPALKSIAEGVS